MRTGDARYSPDSDVPALLAALAPKSPDSVSCMFRGVIVARQDSWAAAGDFMRKLQTPTEYQNHPPAQPIRKGPPVPERRQRLLPAEET